MSHNSTQQSSTNEWSYYNEYCSDSIDFTQDTVQQLDINDKKQYEYNVVIVGQSQSGQTTLLYRLKTGKFIQTQKSKKIEICTVNVPKQNAKLHFYDLIGMTSNDLMQTNSLVIKHSQYVFITFSVADPQWQQILHNWMLFVKTANQNCRIIAVGTQCDQNPVITKQEVQNYIDTSMQIVKVVFCSAKTGEGIDDLLDLPWFVNYKFKRIKLQTPESINEETTKASPSSSKDIGRTSSITGTPAINNRVLKRATCCSTD